MNTKQIALCVQNDIRNPLKWIFSGYESKITAREYASSEQLLKVFEPDQTAFLLLDTDGLDSPAVEYLEKFRASWPTLNIVLFVSPQTGREKVIEIICKNLVQGIIVKPFTAELVIRYIDRFCGFFKSQDS